MTAEDASQSQPMELPDAASIKLRYAIKTALSLTLAYLIPMALGWPQPQTAATTVMLIAATGMVSESLQKGVLRVLGTLAGAVIGLSLVAAFPQDRMLYLLAVSLVVAAIIYLYNAYQGDSTLFMLTAVVTLMVFNGGDAEGAFLWGVDRAFMTAFGVLVYTVVASLLWPVRTADNSRELAAVACDHYQQAFKRLLNPEHYPKPPLDEALGQLVAAEQAFQTQLAAVKGDSDQVAAYLAEWQAIAAALQELQETLLPALQAKRQEPVEFRRFIHDYDAVVERVNLLFGQVTEGWQGKPRSRQLQALPLQLQEGSGKGMGHMALAAIASRADLLARLQGSLLQLLAAQDSLLFDREGFKAGARPRGLPAFIWFDLENLKTALRAFVTFWIATGLWIVFNPPGGFMFVTLTTVLVVLVSYTPVTPKLLIILFTLGFLFAVPAYIFLLPAMTHWLQLAAFLFSYAFAGFFLFKGPVSIFFLLGLFTLGIQNQMAYNFNVILLLILMFYMICATLIITIYFPFSSKPERVYASLRRRFFLACARDITRLGNPGRYRWWSPAENRGALLAKMHSWGAMAASRQASSNERHELLALNDACDLLEAQLQVLSRRQEDFLDNPLIASARRRAQPSPLASLCRTLAQTTDGAALAQRFKQLGARLAGIDSRLDEFLGTDYLQRYNNQQIAHFYVFLNLQASMLETLQECASAQQLIDWQQLEENSF